MKRNTIIRVIARIVGVVILIVGIRMIAEGTSNYVDQHKQNDWVVINAEVTDVSSRLRNTKAQHKQRSTVYDITYEYEVNGEVYSDEIRSQPTPCLVGDDIKIKYNPIAPEESTTSLSPRLSDLLVFVIFGLIFSTLGFFLSGVFALISKSVRKGKPEEAEELPPDEYVKPDNTEQKSRPIAITMVRRIILAVIAVALIMISIKFFPGTNSIDAQDFSKAAEAAGYTTTDTTEKIRQEWRVGSMLTKAVSIDNDNIRVDFCVMDTTDSAIQIYKGMTLPVTDGEVKDIDGMVHEIYTVENNLQFAGKLRIRDTVIYVAALSENKAEVIELLKSIGYWKN